MRTEERLLIGLRLAANRGPLVSRSVRLNGGPLFGEARGVNANMNERVLSNGSHLDVRVVTYCAKAVVGVAKSRFH